MNRWKIAALSAAAVALLVTGCSDAGEPPAAETSASPTADPTPTEKDATVEQWASLIAEQRNAYDDTNQSWKDATCSSLAAVDGAVDCQAMMITMGLIAGTANTTISGAATPDSPTYIGHPPEEIEPLLVETLSAAKIAEDASKPVDQDCFDKGIECAGEANEATRAWDDLGAKYAAWDPYM